MKTWLACLLLRWAYRLDRNLCEATAMDWMDAREYRLAYNALIRRIGLATENVVRSKLGMELKT